MSGPNHSGYSVDCQQCRRDEIQEAVRAAVLAERERCILVAAKAVCPDYPNCPDPICEGRIVAQAFENPAPAKAEETNGLTLTREEIEKTLKDSIPKAEALRHKLEGTRPPPAPAKEEPKAVDAAFQDALDNSGDALSPAALREVKPPAFIVPAGSTFDPSKLEPGRITYVEGRLSPMAVAEKVREAAAVAAAKASCPDYPDCEEPICEGRIAADGVRDLDLVELLREVKP